MKIKITYEQQFERDRQNIEIRKEENDADAVKRHQ